MKTISNYSQYSEIIIHTEIVTYLYIAEVKDPNFNYRLSTRVKFIDFIIDYKQLQVIHKFPNIIFSIKLLSSN